MANQHLQNDINYFKKIHFLVKNIAMANQQQVKSNFDKSPHPHSFSIEDLVWYEDFVSLGKTPKLTPKWQGPAKIMEVNNTNARILLANGKSKVLNVMRLKKFFAPATNTPSEQETL
jgi:hypothetical protein